MNILKTIFALNKQTAAQTIDSAMVRFAMGMLLVGFAYAISVAMFFVGDELAGSLKILKKTAGLLVFVVVLPQFIKLMLMKLKLRGCEGEPEGFVIDVVHKAAEMAFSLTFVFLIAMQVVTEDFLPNLPAGVAVEMIVAVTLGLYCAFFFYFHRDPDDQGDDQFDAEPGS